MARPRRIDPFLVKRAQETAATATSVAALRQCQAVLLPALLGTPLNRRPPPSACAAPPCQSSGSFRRALTPSTQPAPAWGGRRRSLLTPAAERAFLEPWLEQARSGGVVVVSPLRAALAQQLHQPVRPSVIYRLLARHGWRKVAPDTRHPKSDPEVREAWKKNSRKCWQPCDPGGRARPAGPVDVSR